jgi:hypothetical protein
MAATKRGHDAERTRNSDSCGELAVKFHGARSSRQQVAGTMLHRWARDLREQKVDNGEDSNKFQHFVKRSQGI